MKKPLSGCFKYFTMGAVILLAGCGGIKSPATEPAMLLETPILFDASIINLGKACPGEKSRDGHFITIAAWNINRRASFSSAQLTTIVKLLKKYDLIVFQEVARTTGPQAVGQIQTALNAATSNSFEVPHISDKTGAGNESERYAMIWKKDVLTKISGDSSSLGTTLNMARKPFWAHFKVKFPLHSRYANQNKYPFDFILFTVHTKPGRTTELAEINKGANNIASQTGEPDVIIVGDFNAGPDGDRGTGFDKAFRTKFWLFSSNSTMVPTSNPSSTAAAVNDNFVFGPPTVPDYAGGAEVIRFDRDMTIAQARAITDHRIIQAEFCKDNDDDN